MLPSSSVPVGGIEPRQMSTYATGEPFTFSSADVFIVLLSSIKEKRSGRVLFPVTEMIFVYRNAHHFAASFFSSLRNYLPLYISL